MKSANKIIFNTGILYARTALTVGVSLYTTRVVLKNMGADDFGIFNLLAGIITMLSFLNTAMATSTQRFLSFYQGKNDILKQKKIFTHSLLLHIIIGLLIVLCLEAIGPFLFDYLNIPISRIGAAKIVFHLISFTVFFTLIDVPFTGSLTAHENMLWIALTNILETVLRLLVALFLSVSVQDKLVLYGTLMSCISIVSLILYAGYCFLQYDECTLSGFFEIDKKLLKELSKFAGWNLFGSLCSLIRLQGLAILMNMFLGIVVNTAFAIANQLAGQLSFFSITLLRVVNPQIMKSEGASERDRMLRLSMMASKFSFFLLAFIGIPCIFEMPNLLAVWLKTVPDHAIAFCSLIILGILANQLTIGLQSALQATGRIKLYQVVVGSILLLNLPVAYYLLSEKYPVHYVLISYTFIEIIGCAARLFLAKKAAGLRINLFLSRVIGKEIVPIVCSVVVCCLITSTLHFDYRFVLTISASILVFTVAVCVAGLCNDEKQIIENFIKKLLGRLRFVRIYFSKPRLMKIRIFSESYHKKI
jgi:O-antigen/teichoic acid export membrane protein